MSRRRDNNEAAESHLGLAESVPMNPLATGVEGLSKAGLR